MGCDGIVIYLYGILWELYGFLGISHGIEQAGLNLDSNEVIIQPSNMAGNPWTPWAESYPITQWYFMDWLSWKSYPKPYTTREKKHGLWLRCSFQKNRGCYGKHKIITQFRKPMGLGTQGCMSETRTLFTRNQIGVGHCPQTGYKVFTPKPGWNPRGLGPSGQKLKPRAWS